MHLLLLGLILVIGILVYYIMTTSAPNKGASSRKKNKNEQKSKVSENLRKEDNVIFLPTADGDKASNGEGNGVAGSSGDAPQDGPYDGEA